MDDVMKEDLEDLADAGRTALGTIALVAAVVVGSVLVVVLGITVWQHYEGPIIRQEVLNQRHQPGYVDAQNSACRTDIKDYTAAQRDFARDRGDTDAQAADRAHMNAALTDCQSAAGQLSPDEVASDVKQFLSAHSGGGQ